MLSLTRFVLLAVYFDTTEFDWKSYDFSDKDVDMDDVWGEQGDEIIVSDNEDMADIWDV